MEELEINPASAKFQNQEIAPMHTAEHLLNGTMVRLFGCRRACRAHVERTKSKLDYDFGRQLTPDEVARVETAVNEAIDADVPVTFEYVRQSDVAGRFDLERLPDDATPTVRIVKIGDYDECLCTGAHVEHTAQVGRFRITSTSCRDGRLRIVFRLAR